MTLPAEHPIHLPVLKVLGLGGGGCNAVARMMELGLRGVEFLAANTDHQALDQNPAPTKITLGPRTTRGLGAGGDPRVGYQAALESRKEIAAALQGADMVFLTAGMGGGTGTGSISVAAEIARSLGAVTIAIVTTPFGFEMGRRQQNAREGLAVLSAKTNTLISIPNDRLLYVAPRDLSLETAFRLADDVLRQAVQGIAELISEPGMINVDFAHVRRLISLGGGALMSIGHGKGDNKVQEALQQALHHPLLESVCLDNAAGVIANFTGGDDMTLLDVQEALTLLQTQTGSMTEIVPGVLCNASMYNKVQITLVITGLGSPTLEETVSALRRKSDVPEKEPILQEVAPRRRSIADFEKPQPQATSLMTEQISEEDDYAPTLDWNGNARKRTYPTAPTSITNNLDLPAFLRRRARPA